MECTSCHPGRGSCRRCTQREGWPDRPAWRWAAGWGTSAHWRRTPRRRGMPGWRAGKRREGLTWCLSKRAAVKIKFPCLRDRVSFRASGKWNVMRVCSFDADTYHSFSRARSSTMTTRHALPSSGLLLALVGCMVSAQRFPSPQPTSKLLTAAREASSCSCDSCQFGERFYSPKSLTQ